MNCTVFKGRYHDELVCTPFEVLGVAIKLPVMILVIAIVLVLIMVRIDKIIRFAATKILSSRTRLTFHELSVNGDV